MSTITIYHNPRCSKSRQTLALLQEHTDEIKIVVYLNDPLDAETLRTVLSKLGASAHDIVRPKESEYAEAGLSENSPEAEVIDALVRYPKLLERPIVVKGDRAVIGRPPENVHGLF